MSVKLRKYRAPATPETLMRPITGCRISTLVTARAYETLGEQITRANGQPYSVKQRETLMRWLRRLAAEHRGETVATAKGYSRADALYAYDKAFPTGRAIAADITPDQMWEYLKDGWFLSVSGNVDDVPDRSKLDDYVNPVAHEIGIAPFPNAKDEVVVYEPMTPIGRSPIVVRWFDLKRFSSEFATNGRRLCIRVKAGYDTEAQRVRRNQVDLSQTIDRLRQSRNEALGTITARDVEIAGLRLDLAQCQEDGSPAAARLAALEQAQEAANDAIEALKD